jgi:outer membrane lipoprotein carrier protein
VTRVPVWCALFALSSFAADAQPDALLKNVEARYNHAQSLKLSFSETYVGVGHAPARTETGTLYLKKPGRMRWEYTAPAGKLFVSDGKQVFLYTPAQRRVERSRLKQSDDLRAPMAFLLGKLDFSKEFQSFEVRPEGANTWITAEPKNPNLEFSRVEMLAAPNGQILKLHVTGVGNSRIDFSFSDEVLNASVTGVEFGFHPPPGVDVVDEATR